MGKSSTTGNAAFCSNTLQRQVGGAPVSESSVRLSRVSSKVLSLLELVTCTVLGPVWALRGSIIVRGNERGGS